MAANLQDLGLQDIARIDGWVKVDRPEPLLPEFEIEVPESDSAESDSAESGTADSDSAESDSADSDTEELPGSKQPTTDSSGMVTYDHSSAAEQLPEVVEELPDDVLEYNSSPISQRAVPILPIDLQEQDDDEYETLGSEYVQAESRLVDAESPEADSVSGSDDVDSISTDIEEEEEGSLLMEDASPKELCMYVTPIIRAMWLLLAIAQGSKHCLCVLPGTMLGCCTMQNFLWCFIPSARFFARCIYTSMLTYVCIRAAAVITGIHGKYNAYTFIVYIHNAGHACSPTCVLCMHFGGRT